MSTSYGWEVLRQVCAMLLGAPHVPERLCSGSVLGCYNKCSTFTFKTTLVVVRSLEYVCTKFRWHWISRVSAGLWSASTSTAKMSSTYLYRTRWRLTSASSRAMARINRSHVTADGCWKDRTGIPLSACFCVHHWLHWRKLGLHLVWWNGSKKNSKETMMVVFDTSDTIPVCNRYCHIHFFISTQPMLVDTTFSIPRFLHISLFWASLVFMCAML